MLSAGSFKSLALTFSFFLLICVLNSVGSRADETSTNPISLSAEVTTATIPSTEEPSTSSASQPTSTLIVTSTEKPALQSSSSAPQERDGTSTAASAVTIQKTQMTTDTIVKETVSSAQQDYTSTNTTTSTSDLASTISEIFNKSNSTYDDMSKINTMGYSESTTEAKSTQESYTETSDSSLVGPEDNVKHVSHGERSPDPTKKPEKSKTVLAALLTVGLLLAAMIIAGYFFSHKQKWSPKPKRLEETDQNCVENGSHGGKLVSVNSLEPEDQQDKSNLNGGAQENGNSQIKVTATKNEQSNKQADTEL